MITPEPWFKVAPRAYDPSIYVASGLKMSQATWDRLATQFPAPQGALPTAGSLVGLPVELDETQPFGVVELVFPENPQTYAELQLDFDRAQQFLKKTLRGAWKWPG